MLHPGLPGAWAGHHAWTVLDTDFGDGERFLSIRRTWQQDAGRPRMLHYVGIAANASGLCQQAGLPEVCADLGPGFHRILLDDGTVSLTLCLGEVQAVLGEQVFQADMVFAGAPDDKWAAQLLARRCKRGTRLHVTLPAQTSPSTHAADTTALLQAAGFVLDDPATGHRAALAGRFDPHWELSGSRTRTAHVAAQPARCAVIGAGMAGAAVAQALAARGWRVHVLDQDRFPASGASGLPVGLAVPHVSADDNPRSRLTRSGVRLMAQHADRALKRGKDWAPSGVRELRPGGEPVWHPSAFWMKPSALVRVWLTLPGVEFVPHAKVTKLSRLGETWQLLGEHGEDLGCFDVVVLANAMGCAPLLRNGLEAAALSPPLLDKIAALHAVHGTLSHGTYAEPLPGLPDSPVNGNGCFIPHVPGPDGDGWCAGATFEPDALAAADTRAQHALNMQRLRQLLPMEAFDLPDTLDRGPVAQWSATRCVTHDRLPLVGPVDTDAGTGLWLCVGMGARGLSLSALCAELLAARLGAEPLPVEFSLSRSLDVNRIRRKRLP